MEPGPGRFGRCPRWKSARRPLRQRRCLAFLHGAGQGRQRNRSRDSGGLVIGEVAISVSSGRKGKDRRRFAEAAYVSPANSQGHTGCETLSTVSLAPGSVVQWITAQQPKGV